MLLTIQKEIRTIEPVTIEIPLPLFSKKGNRYYSIDSEETVTEVFVGGDYNHIVVILKDSCIGTDKLMSAIEADKIEEHEFNNAMSAFIPYKTSI